MEAIQLCEVCGKDGPLLCSKCRVVFYCSKEHQVSDWKKHKKNCIAFKVRQNEEGGYYVEATRSIKEGSVVLQEMPFVVGPRQGSHMVCLSCLNALETQNFTNCKRCGWTLCSEQCQDNPLHTPECHYIIRRKSNDSLPDFQFNNSLYDGVLVLRCLYQKQFAPKIWEALMKLKSGGEEIKKTKAYETNKEVLIKIIHHNLGLKNEFSVEDIMKVWSIISVNRQHLSIASSAPAGLFEITFLVEHSCNPNCYRVISGDGSCRIVTGKAIAKGERITTSYVFPYWTTTLRQKYLQQRKYFTCKCERCMDITEYGTYFSSHKCQRKNCDGFVLPESFVIKNSQWSCTACKHKTPASASEKLFQHVDQSYNKLPTGSRDQYKAFIKNHEKLLHAKQGYMINAKTSLLFMIGGATDGGIEKVSKEDLLLKVDCCREVLEISRAVIPAEKRIRIDVLNEFQVALEETCRRWGPDDEESENSKLLTDLTENEGAITEAECMLLQEQSTISEPAEEDSGEVTAEIEPVAGVSGIREHSQITEQISEGPEEESNENEEENVSESLETKLNIN